MDINNKYLVIIVIIILIILWYTYSAYSDIDRYKKIIDNFINTEDKKDKLSSKKVSFSEDKQKSSD